MRKKAKTYLIFFFVFIAMRWSGVVMIPKLNEMFMFRYLQCVYDSDSKEGPSVAIPGSEIQPK
ncbi:hypothetical protein Bca4012_027225 [Brassica carinata]